MPIKWGPQDVTFRSVTLDASVDSGADAALVLSAANQGSEAISASGALDPAVRTSLLTVSGTKAYTLADGTCPGQIKVIECVSAASSPLGTVTLATSADSVLTHVFTAVGQRLVMEWRATGWKVTDKKRAGSQTVVVGTDVLTGFDMCSTYNASVTGTVASTGTKAIPNGLVEGEMIFVRCTTAATCPVGTLGITGQTLAGVTGASADVLSINATTDYASLRWDGSVWQEYIQNSMALA